MHIALLIIVALVQLDLRTVLPDADNIVVVNEGRPRTSAVMPSQFDAGTSIGDILNNHFFPAVIEYNTGRYSVASQELTFFVRRPATLDANPRKAEFMSIAYYLRGMIYLYHARGVGRHELAKVDFESAVHWNPSNYIAYVELSRVYSDLGFTNEAVIVLKHLLELKPPTDVIDEAQQELQKLTKVVPQSQ